MLPKSYVKRTYASTKRFVHVWEGEIQTPPYNLNTTFTSSVRKVLDDTRNEVDARNPRTPPGNSDYEKVIAMTTNQAYKRMVDKLGDASSFGATLTAERRDTWSMIVNTVIRVAGAARAITRMRFDQAASLLGLPYREQRVVRRYRTGPKRKRRTFIVKQIYFALPNGRMVLKTLANGWLMYSYGAKPLMQDIYNGMDLLQREFPATKVKGTGRNKSSRVDTWGAPSTYFYIRQMFEYSVSVTQSCSVRVSNPNLWLCNRLGLVNPAQWFLEGIPFSFVADWFSNLSDVVNSMTDFVGLDVIDKCINRRIQIDWSYFNKYYNSIYTQAQRDINCDRRLTLVVPKLVFAYERFQWQRGANAISLLLGFLKQAPQGLKLNLRK